MTWWFGTAAFNRQRRGCAKFRVGHLTFKVIVFMPSAYSWRVAVWLEDDMRRIIAVHGIGRGVTRSLTVPVT